MEYRKFGRLDREFSALGFGAMRLPIVGEDDAKIDEPAAIEILRYAIDQGVNYIDSAYSYHGGNSEPFIAKALRDGYREKVALATKLPVWKVEKPDDFDRFLDEQLDKLQTRHIDFYLLHCLQAKSWPKMRKLGVLPWLERARADGRIGQFGFSFHDRFDVFQEIVDAYDWLFCQIQYNYVNEEVQAGTEGLKYAAERGLAVIVMEPLFGGALASPPQPVQTVFDAANRQCRPADLALRWLWNRPEVSLVLSGMSTLEQVRQNVESACLSGVGTVETEDFRLIAQAREKYEELSPVPCTKCGYCMPCPQGVDIPVNLELLNNATVFQGNSATLCLNLYRSLPEPQRASACERCGTCEEQCPQSIAIGEILARVHKEFGQDG